MKVSSVAMMQPEKSGAKKGMIIGMVCLAVAAVVGCAFGTYAMVSRDSEIAKVREECASASANNDGAGTETTVVTCPDGNEVEVRTEKVIDNKLAANIVNPYLKLYGYLYGIFDVEFGADSKFLLSFLGLRYDDVYSDSIRYNVINSKYQYLFGNDSDLPKKDYRIGGYYFVYNSETDRFELESWGVGGAGLGMFNVIKDTYYDGENLVVEMYHDVLEICQDESGYCMPGTGNFVKTIYPEDGEEFRDFIDSHLDEVPVYKMVFTPNAGHYVLSDVQKQ